MHPLLQAKLFEADKNGCLLNLVMDMMRINGAQFSGTWSECVWKWLNVNIDHVWFSECYVDHVQFSECYVDHVWFSEYNVDHVWFSECYVDCVWFSE